jgi:hypothetical protein
MLSAMELCANELRSPLTTTSAPPDALLAGLA